MGLPARAAAAGGAAWHCVRPSHSLLLPKNSLYLRSGDSRLFLFTVDGKVSAAVAQAKEGPIADFGWSPTGR